MDPANNPESKSCRTGTRDGKSLAISRPPLIANPVRLRRLQTSQTLADRVLPVYLPNKREGQCSAGLSQNHLSMKGFFSARCFPSPDFIAGNCPPVPYTNLLLSCIRQSPRCPSLRTAPAISNRSLLIRSCFSFAVVVPR